MNNNKNINVATRNQQGGTCWFHAIINGLVMSHRCRRYLRTMIKDRGLSPSKNSLGGACPRTIEGFWKYIAYRLKGPGAISPRIRNVNAIKAAGLRRNVANPFGFIPRFGNTLSNYKRRALASRSSVTGGTISDLYNLYKKLFGDDKKNPVFIIRKGNDFPTNLDDYKYILSHAYIQITGKGGFWGHAIAGFINRFGNYKAFDSNNSRHAIDWTWKNSEYDKYTLDWFNEYYGLSGFFKFVSIKKYAVYIRRDLY